MEEKKFPVDVMLLNVAVNNVLNDLVYYQLKEIRVGRPLSEEGETAFKELDEVICFEKVDRDIKVLSSLQESLEKYLEDNPPDIQ
jgi:hypothetical protein